MANSSTYPSAACLSRDCSFTLVEAIKHIPKPTSREAEPDQRFRTCPRIPYWKRPQKRVFPAFILTVIYRKKVHGDRNQFSITFFVARMLSLLWGIWEWLFRKEERKIIIVGVDNAGKSTTLEQLKKQYSGKGMDLEKIPPTIGLNIGRFEINGVVAICWDVGGQLGLRQLWTNYFEEVDGLIFVMDSSDTRRFEESSSALLSALSNKSLASKPLLFFANKNDIPECVSLGEISTFFKIEEIKDRPIKVVSCSAKKNEGLEQGIRWIVEEAVKFNKLRSSSK